MQEYLKTAKHLKKDSPLKDKPITFNSKIKSSGYNVGPSKLLSKSYFKIAIIICTIKI
jgi:hypothetical protein